MTDTTFTHPDARTDDDLGRDEPITDTTATGVDDLAGVDALSSLALLEAEADERAEFPPHVFTNRRDRIRVTCSTEIDSRERQRWERASMPAQERKATRPAMLSMDAFGYMCRVVINTCEMIEVRRGGPDGPWVPITDASGEMLTFRDPEVHRAMKAIDAVTALRNAMNRVDADITNAGDAILTAAGYGAGDDDEDVDGLEADPTRR